MHYNNKRERGVDCVTQLVIIKQFRYTIYKNTNVFLIFYSEMLPWHIHF